MSFRKEPLATTEPLDEWAELLSAAAPALPPALKGRTLTRCESVMAMRTRQQHGNRRLAWAIAGVLAGQWLLAACFDAQTAALLNGPAGQNHSHNSHTATPPGAIVTAMRRRSQQMSALLVNRDDGSTAERG